MLKLNAAYSKKVPAEGEYTSQSYHATAIRIAIADIRGEFDKTCTM